MRVEPYGRTNIGCISCHPERLAVGKRVELWKQCTTIGRSRDSDIFLEDIAVIVNKRAFYYSQIKAISYKMTMGVAILLSMVNL